MALVRGMRDTIKWEDTKSSSVRIKLFRSNEKWLDITDNTLNTGMFIWDISPDIPEDTVYSVRIYSNDDDFLYYSSEGNFAVISLGDTSSFTDIRDGKMYHTVKIGSQWWMAENFDLEVGGDNYCYDYDIANCVKFGRLYNINDAVNLAPPGWHLPSDKEWRQMEAYLGIHEENRFKQGFRGGNAGLLLREGGSTGFDAKFCGYMYLYYSSFTGMGLQCWYWTSTFKAGVGSYYARNLSVSTEGINRQLVAPSRYRMSVRYIRNEEN